MAFIIFLAGFLLGMLFYSFVTMMCDGTFEKKKYNNSTHQESSTWRHEIDLIRICHVEAGFSDIFELVSASPTHVTWKNFGGQQYVGQYVRCVPVDGINTYTVISSCMKELNETPQ